MWILSIRIKSVFEPTSRLAFLSQQWWIFTLHVQRVQICVLCVDELNKEILDEVHSYTYAMHLESTKMYKTLKPF